MSGPLLGAAALVIVALISLVGARLTSRDTRKASREAQDMIARIDERKVSLDEFNAVQERNETALARADAAIERLEDALRHEQEQRRLSNAYARTLAQAIRDMGKPVPPPPAGLDLP